MRSPRSALAGVLLRRASHAYVLTGMAVAAATVLFATSAAVKTQPANAYVVCSLECPHEYMALKALQVFPNAEVADNFPSIQSGITHEDEFDHVYGLNAKDPLSGDPILATSTHFWDADAGPLAVTHNAHPFGDFQNAWQKAQAFWSLALGRYAKNDKGMAYHYLGHIVHLFGDATVPAHDHDEAHGPEPLNDDGFHDWMDVKGDPPENAKLTQAELDALIAAKPLGVPDSEPNKLKWLLYRTNQIGDFFASDGTDGDSTAGGYDGDPAAGQKVQEKLTEMANNPALSRLQDHHELDDNDVGDDNDDGDLGVIRESSYLPGIGAIAGLYQTFEHAAKRQITLAVVIDRVEEDEGHDDFSGPDFYARVAVAGLESRNRGEQFEDTEDIDPGWAFGSTVPPSGSVPVRVEIWDENGGYDDSGPFLIDDDVQSDIDTHGGAGDLGLELNVDLAKCLRRQPGAISGDITGDCGATLSEAGDHDDEDASLIRFRVFASKSPPTADAGGPYTTKEGTNVALSGTGSSDPDNDIETYAWDLDGDGSCDDVTDDATPDFTAVGQDGQTTVKLCVTDAVGLTAEDTATVTVTNEAPSISLGSDAPKGENTAVTVSGTIRDPGWLDSLSGTISWGDGSAVQALSGTLENTRPDATLTFSAAHTYGDNGTFTAQVCARDDDTNPCTTIALQVDNTNPTAAIDLSGAVDVNGTPTVIAHAGAAVGFSGRSTDPGSDDLTLTWTWGDGGAPSSTTRLVNATPEPVGTPSPSIQPRDVTDSRSHSFAGACAYETTFGARDDDGGSASRTAAVIIVGNGHPNQPHGYWKQQFRYHLTGKNNSDFDAAALRCYLKIVDYMSRVFDQRNDASTFLRAADILDTSQTSATLELFDQQLLAAWLNFANGAVEWNRLVDTNGDKRADTRFLDAIIAAETLRLNPNATRTQLDKQKLIVESWTKLP